MIRQSQWTLAAAVWVALAPRVPASADDLQVNTYTTDSQIRPSVAMDADGNVIVVWQSRGSSGTDSSLSSVQVRRYATDGSALGGELQVNTYTTSSQASPSVAVDGEGGFVVVWVSFGSRGPDSSSTSVQMRRFAADGSPVGIEHQVNTYTTSLQYAPAVAVGARGHGIVVWQSNGSAGTDTSSRSVQGQRFASDGTPAGGEFQINTTTTRFQGSPAVAAEENGDFVVVWSSDSEPGTQYYAEVMGQRYASDGTPVGGEFQVNSYLTGLQASPSVAVDADGDFVVVWQDFGPMGSDRFNVHGRRFASNGDASGSEFRVNAYSTDVQHYPAVAMAANGDFMVVWGSLGSGGTDSSDHSVHGRRFAADGAAVGGELQINTITLYSQDRASVSVDDDGGFVVVWQSAVSRGTDTSSYSIQRSEVPLFRDGFESGDTSVWSAAVR